MRTVTLEIDGRPRRARITGEGPNLLLYFHGSRQSSSVARRFTHQTFEWPGWTTAYLDGFGHHFNDRRRELREAARTENIDDVAFTRTLVAELAPQYAFACGYSNGGHMVQRLLVDAPGLLTAAACIAATEPAPHNALPAAAHYHPTPVLFMHGTADAIAPYEGGVAGLDAASGRGEVLAAEATARLWAQRNKETAAPESVQVAPDVSVLRWPSVELWNLIGAGHVIPTGHPAPEPLGPTTDSVVAGEVIRQFFAAALR